MNATHNTRSTLATVLFVAAGLLALGATALLLHRWDDILFYAGLRSGSAEGGLFPGLVEAMALLGGLYVALAVALRR